MSNSDTLLVTAGEPAGIGPDLCLQLAGSNGPMVVVADPLQLQQRATLLGLDTEVCEYTGSLQPGRLNVLPIKLANAAVCGDPDPANAEAILDGLARATDACINGEFAALVTAPMQKSVINDAGIPFSGHTEFVAERASVADPVMMLAADDLRVALVSTHLPLRKVADYITEERVAAVIGTVHRELQQRFNIANPRLLVCGLNPHAGEGGHLGTEDDAVIRPAVAAAREAGIDAVGPLPADTAFTPAAGVADAVIAMYHDQGLPVLKHAGFGHAVNITLGLPIIRTSVDHGTALDLAGTGQADSGSLEAAIALARRLASNA